MSFLSTVGGAVGGFVLSPVKKGFGEILDAGEDVVDEIKKIPGADAIISKFEKVGENFFADGKRLVGLVARGPSFVILGPLIEAEIAIVVYPVVTLITALITHRSLTDKERAFVELIFGNTLPSNKNILITNLVGIGGRPFTIPNLIGDILVNLGAAYDNPLDYADTGYPRPGQLLINELTHAWQIHHSGFTPGFICEGAWEQLQYTFGKDVYNPALGGPDWNDFTHEAQATIVDRWYQGGCPLNHPFYQYIFKNINEGSTPPILQNPNLSLPEILPQLTTVKVCYSCLWNAGTQGQVWGPNLSEEEFRTITGDLWSWARPAQVQAFIANNEVRYSCLWNEGTYGQVWGPNLSEQEFRTITGDNWSWARPAQVQGFVSNGEVRYSCLWNEGTYGQVWWPNLSEQELRAKTEEVLSWARLAQMQAFVVDGAVRYSCLWQEGSQGQVWEPNISEQEFRSKTDELWNWARPAECKRLYLMAKFVIVAYGMKEIKGKYGHQICQNKSFAQQQAKTGSGLVRLRYRHLHFNSVKRIL
ncbi:MAG: hypothetical protein WKG06_10505 [Segetibacter sp.]